MLLEFELHDVTTPDYYNGNLQTYFAIDVTSETSIRELKESIGNAIRYGEICGNSKLAHFLSTEWVPSYYEKAAHACCKAVCKSLNRFTLGARKPFKNVQGEGLVAYIAINIKPHKLGNTQKYIMDFMTHTDSDRRYQLPRCSTMRQAARALEKKGLIFIDSGTTCWTINKIDY